eukprot:2496352-Rhodomonas_salina.2
MASHPSADLSSAVVINRQFWTFVGSLAWRHARQGCEMLAMFFLEHLDTPAILKTVSSSIPLSDMVGPRGDTPRSFHADLARPC